MLRDRNLYGSKRWTMGLWKISVEGSMMVGVFRTEGGRVNAVSITIFGRLQIQYATGGDLAGAIKRTKIYTTQPGGPEPAQEATKNLQSAAVEGQTGQKTNKNLHSAAGRDWTSAMKRSSVILRLMAQTVNSVEEVGRDFWPCRLTY